MREAAKLMRERADLMAAEMGAEAGAPYPPYWTRINGDVDERYRAGVKNGLGGSAGEMAAPFDLSTAYYLAELLMKLAWLHDVEPGALGADIDGKLLRMCRAYLGEEAP
jgi:hypothetical protein